MLIEEIFEELKKKHGLTKYEIEKIVDSQFRYTVEHIGKGDIRPVKWKYLGKIRPSDYFVHLKLKQQRDAVAKEI